MAALVAVALALTSYASLTDRPLEGVPAASTPVRERLLILEGHSAQAVTVRTPDGQVLVDLPHGGFVTVIQSGMATERRKHGIVENTPVRLVEYANHRLVLEDPATGWSAELYAFGDGGAGRQRRDRVVHARERLKHVAAVIAVFAMLDRHMAVLGEEQHVQSPFLDRPCQRRRRQR